MSSLRWTGIDSDPQDAPDPQDAETLEELRKRRTELKEKIEEAEARPGAPRATYLRDRLHAIDAQITALEAGK